jgi:thymidylate kinase
MSKAQTKNARKKQRAQDKTPEPATQRGGRLIALDGTSGPSLMAEGVRLARLCCEDSPACSMWDASNTFHELGMAKSKTLTPTPRTLILLYASDLLFRLRWEIEPTLQEGHNVVAAPYVQTAIAFGVAAGLPKDWLEELFSFAPKAVASFRLKEKKKVKKKEKNKDKSNGKKRADAEETGYVEFCCKNLSKISPSWDSADVRAAMIAYLKEQDDLNKFGKKVPKALRLA